MTTEQLALETAKRAIDLAAQLQRERDLLLAERAQDRLQIARLTVALSESVGRVA